MPDLFDRLFPTDPDADNIPVHHFFSALVDYAAGYTTRAQITAYWNLDADAQVDLNTMCDHIDGLPSAIAKVAWGTELHAVLMFSEAGAKYNTKATFRTRLGL